MNRILHQFMRSMGAKLPWPIVEFTCNYLLSVWSIRDFVEALDIVMTATDIALTQEHSVSDIVAHRLSLVAPPLKALGRHGEAALVSYEAAEMYVEDIMELAAYYEDSGVAFMVARDFEMAEDAFVKALHACYEGHGNILDVLDAHVIKLLMRVFAMYIEWPSSEGADQELATVSVIFQFLASTVSSVIMTASHTSIRYHEIIRQYVKESFQTTKQAKRLLEEAIRSSSPRHFRDTIITCVNPSNANDFQVWIQQAWIPSLLQVEFPSTFGKSSSRQEYAKKQLQDRNMGAMKRCSNPACGVRAPASQ